MEAWEFGSAVRRWRDRVDPDAAGLPVGARGRAPAGRDPGAGIVSSHIPPSVQRLLDRFEGIPMVVYDAAWNLVVANAPYDALMGDTSLLRGNARNAVWRNILGPPSRARQSPEEHARVVSGLVAGLRATVARHPSDARLRRLVAELRAESGTFATLWDTVADAPAAGGAGRRKVVEHPLVGPIELDCDTLVVALDGLRIMVYTAEPGTAEPGTADAERLQLAIVLGTQALVEP